MVGPLLRHAAGWSCCHMGRILDRFQYAQAFNHLCQYAGYHANTNARKRDCFCRGLNTKLKERLNLVRADNFNELVNMAITQEDCISAHRVEKKWKIPTGPSNAQPPRYRLVQNTAT
jgi:hypothetical protein